MLALIDTLFEMSLSPFHLFKSCPSFLVLSCQSDFMVSQHLGGQQVVHHCDWIFCSGLANAVLIILIQQHDVFTVSLELFENT